MFLSFNATQWVLPLCPWQIFCVVSCWALAPLAVCFAVFRMVRRKSGWGICVLPWFCLFVRCWFLLLWFAKLHVTTGVHVAVFLPTASTHVRTEPLSVIGHTGGKKAWTKKVCALHGCVSRTNKPRQAIWCADLWKFDALREHPLGKGEATCHSSSWHSFMHGRLVENILLVARETCALWSIWITIFY